MTNAERREAWRKQHQKPANTYCMERRSDYDGRLCQNSIPIGERVCAECRQRKEKEGTTCSVPS